MKRSKSTAGIIASFNQEQYIVEAVESLIHQVDELIVVDDQSSDGTLYELRTLQSAHSNLNVIKPSKKLGVSGAYNLAVMESDSKVLILQGGDDISLSNRVSNQVQVLDDPEVCISYSSPIIVNRNSHILPDQIGKEFQRDLIFEDVLAELFFNGNFICAPSVAIRRSDYLRMGGFLANVDTLQDYALWLRCTAEGSARYSDVPFVKYRKHGNNLSRQNMRSYRSLHRENLERNFVLNNFLDNCNPSTLKRLLRATSFQGPLQNETEQMLKVFIKMNHGNTDFRLSGVQDLLKYSQDSNFSEFEMRTYHNFIESLISAQ